MFNHFIYAFLEYIQIVYHMTIRRPLANLKLTNQLFVSPQVIINDDTVNDGPFKKMK